jgi:hypothetical protein
MFIIEQVAWYNSSLLPMIIYKKTQTLQPFTNNSKPVTKVIKNAKQKPGLRVL